MDNLHAADLAGISNRVLTTQVTIVGDLACIVASTAVIAYLSVGRHLRSWMPLFVYAFPVTGAPQASLTAAVLRPKVSI